MDISLAHTLQDWIQSIFYKEGIAIYVILSVMFFLLASFLVIWAIKSGEFRDMESAKFEMMEDVVVQ